MLLCFIFFCDLVVVTHFAPIRFYKQATSCTETCTQRSFYAQILFHREVCAQINLYTQTPLHTEAFTQRNFYTEVFTHRCFADCTKMLLHAQMKAHKRIYTEPFTQRNLCTEQLLRKEIFTRENFDTEKMS